jgi:YHS domain-containing protein
MKKFLALTMVASFVLMPLAVHAEDVAKVEVGNKICPISGEPVGTMGPAVKIEHNGKTYNLCCGMCAKEFNDSADKYAKVADDEVAASVAQE